MDSLNGGAGFTPGKIQITDRNGASTTIDLSSARTVGDVLNAINNNGVVNVTAAADGGKIVLTDHTGQTGQTASNLKVQEVGNGSTAASLGLAGINVAASSATGADILSLGANTSVSALNDGAGVSTNTVLPDIQFNLANGNSVKVDLSPSGNKETTLGQIVNEINAAGNVAGNVELTASIDSQNNRLVVTDNTSGGDTFSAQALNGSSAVHNLGLDTTSNEGTIYGLAILGGLQSPLLSSLNGGQGFGQLGKIDLTDRNGNTAVVDLSSAQTLGKVIDDINGAKTGITAQINAAANGIELVDSSGGSQNMIVADDPGDQDSTATKLGIAVNAAVSSVNSGDLHLQTVSMNTALSSLNGGAGVAQGTFQLTNTLGVSATVTVDSTMQTVGDVVNAVNRLNMGVQASIDSTGDGILLTDTNNGSDSLTVAEGNSTTAADLHLIQTVPSGQTARTIDGSTTQKVKLVAGDTLSDLETKINSANVGATASILNDGSSNPYRLMLTSNQLGEAGALTVDTSQLKTSMSLTQTVKPQDALLALGGAGNGTSGVLISSSNNQFTDVLPGATLQIGQPTGQPATVTVAADDASLSTEVQTLVNDYNSYHTTLTTDTAYTSSTNTSAVLSDDPTAIQMDASVSGLFNGQILGAGALQSLAQLGVTQNSDGSLSFDSSTFSAAYASNPASVQQFFTQKGTGFAVQLDNVANQLAGSGDSLLSGQITAISSTVEQNTDKINSLNSMLDDERTRLYDQFYQMEAAVAQLQTSMSVVNSLSLLNSDGSSTPIFSDAASSSTLGTDIASIVAADATNAASSATSSTSSTTSS